MGRCLKNNLFGCISWIRKMGHGWHWNARYCSAKQCTASHCLRASLCRKPCCKDGAMPGLLRDISCRSGDALGIYPSALSFGQWDLLDGNGSMRGSVGGMPPSLGCGVVRGAPEHSRKNGKRGRNGFPVVHPADGLHRCFGLLRTRLPLVGTELIRKPGLMNAIWEYYLEYTMGYNAQEQAGLNDGLVLLLFALGLVDRELERPPKHMIAMSPNTGTDFIGVWKRGREMKTRGIN